MKSVLVYCGAQSGKSEKYITLAKELGELMVKNNLKLIFGGGNVGLMGVLSNTMLGAGGYVVGVIPQRLVDREVANNNCSELIVVKDMQERKTLMEENADFIVTLPGGYGSMDELFESLTNAQLDIHEKPVFVLNFDGFYDLLLKQLDVMTAEGFLLQKNREKLNVSATPQDLVKSIIAFT